MLREVTTVSLLRLDSTTAEIRRYDRVDGSVALRPSVTRPDGSMLCEGIVAREGILEYRDGRGGVRRELVTREALDSMMATLARAPVTLEHPDEGMVSPDNFGALGVGDVDGEADLVREEMGGFVRVRLAVRRRDALDAVSAGKVELSPGYKVVLDETPGEHPLFGRYDARQLARTTNHLAIVDRARGGSTVRLRADSADAVMVGAISTPGGDPATTRDRSLYMKPLLVQLAALLGVTRTDSEDAVLADLKPAAEALKAKADASDRLQADRDAQKARADKADGDMEKLQTQLDEMTAERDAMKAELEALRSEKKDAADRAEAARLDGIAKAREITVDGLDLKGKRLAVAAHVLGAKPEDLAKRSDAYIDALIDTAAKAAPAREDGGDPDPLRGDGRVHGARVDDFYSPYTPAKA